MPELSRFNAQTNDILDKQLETLSKELGFNENQQSDLLAELTSIASWVIRQTQAGRSIEARDGSKVELLESPILNKLKSNAATPSSIRILLEEQEAAGLRELLVNGHKHRRSVEIQDSQAPEIVWRTGA